MSVEIRLINKDFIEPNVFSEKILEITKKKGNHIEKNDKGYGTIFKVYNLKKSEYFSIDLPNKKEFNDSLKFHNNKYGILVQIDFSSHLEESLDNFIFPFIKDIIDFFPEILINSGSDINYTYEEFIKFNEE